MYVLATHLHVEYLDKSSRSDSENTDHMKYLRKIIILKTLDVFFNYLFLPQGRQ